MCYARVFRGAKIRFMPELRAKRRESFCAFVLRPLPVRMWRRGSRASRIQLWRMATCWESGGIFAVKSKAHNSKFKACVLNYVPCFFSGKPLCHSHDGFHANEARPLADGRGCGWLLLGRGSRFAPPALRGLILPTCRAVSPFRLPPPGFRTDTGQSGPGWCALRWMRRSSWQTRRRGAALSASGR